MNTVRCLICRLRFQKLKLLYSHYLKLHSKTKIILKLLEENSKQVLIKNRKYPKKSVNTCGKITELNPYECNSFILHENIRIFCGENEIISIGNEEQSVQLTFNNETQDKCYLPWNKVDSDFKNLSTKKIKQSTKRKIKKKKIPRRKKEDYHINITKLKSSISLDDQNGIFYTCYCRDSESENFRNPDTRLITSDTESCSETSKNLEESKLFCCKCGSGYKTEIALSEHMYVHEPFCRLCNTWFHHELAFKQHMQLHKIRIFACHLCGGEFTLKENLFKHFNCHMENKVMEDILDMEGDYNSYNNCFVGVNYNDSIVNIMRYLKEMPDMYYYNSNCVKTICDFCYKEISIREYERHLQLFHR